MRKAVGGTGLTQIPLTLSPVGAAHRSPLKLPPGGELIGTYQVGRGSAGGSLGDWRVDLRDNKEDKGSCVAGEPIRNSECLPALCQLIRNKRFSPIVCSGIGIETVRLGLRWTACQICSGRSLAAAGTLIASTRTLLAELGPTEVNWR